MFYFEDEPGAAISGQQGGLLRIVKLPGLLRKT
jgi:hypothetical protein